MQGVRKTDTIWELKRIWGIECKDLFIPYPSKEEATQAIIRIKKAKLAVKERFIKILPKKPKKQRLKS